MEGAVGSNHRRPRFRRREPGHGRFADQNQQAERRRSQCMIHRDPPRNRQLPRTKPERRSPAVELPSRAYPGHRLPNIGLPQPEVACVAANGGPHGGKHDHHRSQPFCSAKGAISSVPGKLRALGAISRFGIMSYIVDTLSDIIHLCPRVASGLCRLHCRDHLETFFQQP